MTFPRNEQPGPETASGPSESESPTDSHAPPRADDPVPSSQGDLWSPEAAPATTSTDLLAGTPSALADGSVAFDSDEPQYGPDETGNAVRRRYKRIAWELTQTLVLAVLIFLLVRTVAQNFRVEGPSMEPGLHNGQYLLVNKAVYFKLNVGPRQVHPVHPRP